MAGNMAGDKGEDKGEEADHATGDAYAGQLFIRMDVKHGRVTDVDIRSTRPADAARVFHGRAPADVARLMGALFSLCARAQTVCALNAMEDALGLRVAPATDVARDVLRLSEMISQIVLRLGLDWPRLLRLTPRADAVRACLNAERAIQAALFGDEPWTVPGGVDFTPDKDAVLEQVNAITAMVDDLLGGGFADDLRRALAAAWLDGFGATPQGACEDGALARRWDDPDVARVRAMHDAGLAARLEARLVDLKHTAEDLAGAAAHVAPASAAPGPAARDGHATATVETARGPLHHAVTIADGVIQAYAITAPTDANFAPTGAVAAGLAGARADDLDALNRAAELHALAVDPCVACSIEVGHA